MKRALRQVANMIDLFEYAFIGLENNFAPKQLWLSEQLYSLN